MSKVIASQVNYDKDSEQVCCALDLEKFNFPLNNKPEINLVNSILKKRLEQSLCVLKTFEQHKQFAVDNALATLQRMNMTTSEAGLYSKSMDSAFKRIFISVKLSYDKVSLITEKPCCTYH